MDGKRLKSHPERKKKCTKKASQYKIKPLKLNTFSISQNYFAHHLKRGNFLSLLLFLKQEWIVFSLLEEKICFYFTKSTDERNGGDTILHVGFWHFFFLQFIFFLKERVRVEKIGTWQKWISVAILNSAALEPEHRAQSSTTASHSLCLSSCWKDSVSVQGTHTSVDLHWIQICLCENSIGQRYPSQPAMGTEKEPGHWLLTACWWNVLFDFPVTVPVGWEEGPSPHCHVNTTKLWKTATWYWP